MLHLEASHDAIDALYCIMTRLKMQHVQCGMPCQASLTHPERMPWMACDAHTTWVRSGEDA